MKKSIIAVLLIAGAGGVVHADATKQKAGLWETKVTKQIVDGKDLGAQLAAAPKVDPAKLQAALANVPPEQRAMVEARIKAAQSGGGGTGGAFRYCVTEAMAEKHMFGSHDGTCGPSNVSFSGNKMSYSMNCSRNGHAIVGTGQVVFNGDTVAIHTESTLTDANGSHNSVVDMQSSYLGADCQGVKPVEIPAR
jgi:hypothetical protein